MQLPVGGRGGHSQLTREGAGTGHVQLHEQHQDLLLPGRQTGRRRGRPLAGGLEGGLLRHLDGEHGPPAEVILDRDRAAQEAERLAGDRQARAHAPEAPLARGGGGEAGQEGAILVVDAGAVVGDAHDPAGVEDGDDHVAKEGVDEVLDELVDDRERHVAALLPAGVVGLFGERRDQPGDVALLDAHDPRRTRERVVDGDARGAGPQRRGGGDHPPEDVRARLVDRRPSTAAAGPTAGPAVVTRATPGGRRILGQQPVEERLHGGMQYTRGGAPGRSM